MKIPAITDPQLQSICDVLGDTGGGLTGSEIQRALNSCGIEDVEPLITKRHRIFQALQRRQSRDGCANNVMNFIQHAMSPSTYIKNPEVFEERRTALNIALSFLGYELGEDGKVKVRSGKKAETLTEASVRTKKLKTDLEERNVHPEVLKFCREELLQDNYFHAVFEANKSVAERIRTMTELSSDGTVLIEEAFSLNHPLLMINGLTSETEKSEHKGFVNFIKGIIGMFRNTTAHAPKIYWKIQEQDALDILSSISLVHRKLDRATRTGLPPRGASH